MDRVTPPLSCPSCRRHFDLRQYLDTCGGAYPAHQAVRWTCPACGHDGIARLTTGALELGHWDAFPGPRLVVQQAHRDVDWSVTWADAGPVVQLPEGAWLLGAAPSAWLPELRLLGGPPREVGEAALREAEERLQQPLPPSYRAFMGRYGPGLAMDSLRIFAPARLRRDGRTPELLVFGEGPDGQRLGWNTRLRAGRGELWMDVLFPGASPSAPESRRANVAASLGELLLLAVDAGPRHSGDRDPLGLGSRYTERVFEPAED